MVAVKINLLKGNKPMKQRVDTLQIGQAFWSPVEYILSPTGIATFVSEIYIVTQEWNSTGGFQCSPSVTHPVKYLNLAKSPILYGIFLTKSECAQECSDLNTAPQQTAPVNGIPMPNTLKYSGSGTVYFDPNAISDTEKDLQFEDTKPYFEIKCECGGDVAGTTHTDWCPKYNKER